MIGNDHEVSGLPGGVHTACGIGEHEIPDSEYPEGLDGIDALLECPALIVVEASLHAQNLSAFKLTDCESALVSRHR